MIKCEVCGKAIIGSDVPICHVCKIGISPESIKLKADKKNKDK